MKNNNTYSIEISLQPAVVKWIDATFEKTENGYDLRNEPHYILIRTALMRKNIRVPGKKAKKQEKYIKIKLLINEWDFYHFGWEIPTFAQIRISKLLFHLMMLKICEHIAHAYAYANIPRDVTIRRILVEYLFDDDEMNYYYIRKYYQRKFQNTGKEQEIIDFVKYTIDYLEEYKIINKKNV